VVRITVVNDYPDFLETMRDILSSDGHEVTGFDGDRTTIDDIADSRPELLIVDLRIAGDHMKGWDTLVLARLDERLAGVPLIVCSGDVDTLRERGEDLRRQGNIHTLEKPFGVDDALAAVHEALGG
jgi:DNA-binding NtrC family response regulator